MKPKTPTQQNGSSAVTQRTLTETERNEYVVLETTGNAMGAQGAYSIGEWLATKLASTGLTSEKLGQSLPSPRSKAYVQHRVKAYELAVKLWNGEPCTNDDCMIFLWVSTGNLGRELAKHPQFAELVAQYNLTPKVSTRSASSAVSWKIKVERATSAAFADGASIADIENAYAEAITRITHTNATATKRTKGGN